MELKLSVIIPTYNAEDYLLDAVNSIKNQTFGFENIELILVDDNSQDNTVNIICDLANKYKNVISVFSKDNSGTASGPRNLGIEVASTNFIMFLDNDDEYYPQMCELMYNTIFKNNVDVVTCRYNIVKNKVVDKPKSFLDSYPNFIQINNIDDFPEIMTLGFPTMIWTKIFKKEFILNNNIKFPIGHLYEDVFFSSDAYLHTKGIIILNDFYGYKYNVRISGDNKSTSQVFTKSLVEKQLNGFLDVMNLKNIEKYVFLYNEIIVDLSKIYLYSDLNRNNQKFFLNQMKPYYKNYKIGARIHTASLPFNILINFFIKIFSISNFLAIFISDLYFFLKKLI